MMILTFLKDLFSFSKEEADPDYLFPIKVYNSISKEIEWESTLLEKRFLNRDKEQIYLSLNKLCKYILENAKWGKEPSQIVLDTEKYRITIERK